MQSWVIFCLFLPTSRGIIEMIFQLEDTEEGKENMFIYPLIQCSFSRSIFMTVSVQVQLEQQETKIFFHMKQTQKSMARACTQHYCISKATVKEIKETTAIKKNLVVLPFPNVQQNKSLPLSAYVMTSTVINPFN